MNALSSKAKRENKIKMTMYGQLARKRRNKKRVRITTMNEFYETARRVLLPVRGRINAHGE